MKNKLLFILSFVYSSFLLAQPIGVDEARHKALEFLSSQPTSVNGRNHAPKKLSDLKLVHHAPMDNGQNAYYVFNNEAGGFVIVSGDDRANDVLGYSDKGTFVADNVPINMKEWLEEYAQQIKYIQEQTQSSSSIRKTPARAAVAPMLTTKWDQGYPYNTNCPDFFGQGKCVTGCEATALAQVMFYHRAKSVNKTTTTIPGYTCEREWTIDSKPCHIEIDAIPAGSPIDWNNMRELYNGSETAAQTQAIANLMKYCGASMNMDYAKGQSDAHIANAPIALKTYFDYRDDTELVWRLYISSNDEWETLIYNELSNNRPVFYHGMHSTEDDADGHVFVCDGYDGTGYYHFNWGWSGSYDGYFLLSAIGPNEDRQYPYWQAALINAAPNEPDVPSIYLSTDAIELYVNMSDNVEIHNGSGEYEIINDYPDIVEAEIDYLMERAPSRRDPIEEDEGKIDFDSWHIVGKKVGNAVLKLKDLKTNKVLTLNVKVKQAPSLSLETSSLSLKVGDSDDVEILTGSGYYQVTCDKPEVVRAERRDRMSRENRSIIVSIRAKSVGTATVTVKDMSSLEEKTIFVTVTDTSTSPISITPTEIDFGEIVVGSYAERYLTIKNESDEPQKVKVRIEDFDYDGFYLRWADLDDDYFYQTIQPGEEYLAEIDFHTSTTGDYASIVLITSETTDNWQCVVPLKAKSVHPLSFISVTPTKLDFGIVKLGTDKTQELTITNTGENTVKMTMDGCTDSRSNFDVSNNQEEVTLAPGDSKVYTVTAHGTQAGCAPTQSLLVKCEGFDEEIEVKMSSFGDDDDPIIDIIELSLNVGETASVKVRNSGYYSVVPDDESMIELSGGGGAGVHGGPIDRHHPWANYEETEWTIKALKAGVVHVTFTDEHTHHSSVLTIIISEESTEIPAEAIDLGLPSGTLWASYNVGATKPEEFGGYYAWGETEIKDSYSWDNYLLCNGTAESCVNIGNDISGSQYDVATQKWGANWRMPTSNEFKELEEECDWTWTSVNGISGHQVTGPNGNAIFLPAVGSGFDGGEGIGSTGFYWTSALYDSSLAYYFTYYQDFLMYTGKGDRYQAHSIRPVMTPVPIISVTPTEIDFGVVKLGTDKTMELTVTNTSNSNIIVKMDGCTTYISRFEVSENQEDVTLAPKESKVYTVTAHGMAAGAEASQKLFVKNDASDEEIEVKLLSIGDDDEPLIDKTDITMKVGESVSVKANVSSYFSAEPDDDYKIVSFYTGGPSGMGGPIDRHEPMYGDNSKDISFTALQEGIAHITFTDLHTNKKAVLTIVVKDEDDGIEDVIATGKPVEVYSLMGMRLYSGFVTDELWNKLPTGVYVVNGKRILKMK